MNRKPENHVPFEGLEGYSQGKYHEVSLPTNDPEMVVKIARTEWAEQHNPGWYELNDLKSIAGDLRLLKEASFSEFIPPTQLVVGQNEKGEEVTYVLQDRIFGDNLDQLEYSEKVAEQVRKFLDKSLDFYIANLTTSIEYGSVSFIPDIKGVHFIYGVDRKRGEKDPRLYFVDTYPVHEVGATELVDRYLPKHREAYFTGAWKDMLLDFEARVKKRLSEVGAV